MEHSLKSLTTCFFLFVLCLYLCTACGRSGEEPPALPQEPEPTPSVEPEVTLLPVSEEDMQLVIDPHGHAANIQDVMFTPDGKTLVSVSNDKTIRVWDTETGKILKTIRGHIGEGAEGKLYAGALSPDGNLLAVGGFLGQLEEQSETPYFDGFLKLADFKFDIGQVRIIELRSGEQITTLRGHANVIYDIAFSADGQWLATTGADDTIRLWDVSGIRTRAESAILPFLILEGHTGDIYAVSFSPDRRQLVSASYDGTLRLWELPETVSGFDTIISSQHRLMDRHTAGVRSVAYSPNGNYILSGGKDRKLLLWNGNGRFLKELATYSGTIATISVSADSSQAVVSGMGEFEAIVYDISSGKAVSRFSDHTNSVVASAFYGTSVVATAGNDTNIYLWYANSGIRKCRIVGKGMTNWAVAFGEGLQLAFGQHDYSPPMFQGFPQEHLDYFPLEQIFDFSEMALHPAPPVSDTFRGAVTSYQSNTLTPLSPYALKIAPETVIRNDQGYDGLLRAFTFSPGGDIVVGSSFSLKLYSQTGKRIRTFHGHTGEVFSVSVSRDGRMLASASNDQTIRLWNIATGECLAILFVASDHEWVCWTPQGFYIASPQGEDYIGWHRNQGMESSAVYYPVSVFRKLYLHPSIVKKIISLGHSKQALTVFKNTTPGIIQTCHIADVLPPVIEWLNPQTLRTEVNESTLQIQATVYSQLESEITDVQLLLDGTPVVKGKQLHYKGTASLFQKEFEYEVPLSPGQHTVRIAAATEYTKVVSESRIVEMFPQTPVAEGEPQQEPKRLALVIGNTAYQHVDKLYNPVNDARAMDDVLRDLGFDVLRFEDVTQKEMKRAIDTFGARLKEYDIGLFYYSGHGLQVNGVNFLVPVDADITSKHHVEYHCVNAERVFAHMEFAANPTNIIILDACRDDPFHTSAAKSMGGGNGLAFMQAPSGTLIAYATSPGRVAFDDPNKQNSLYTAALLQHIEEPNIPVLEMFQRVRKTVREDTNNQQTPWESTSLTGNFYFQRMSSE